MPILTIKLLNIDASEISKYFHSYYMISELVTNKASGHNYYIVYNLFQSNLFNLPSFSKDRIQINYNERSKSIRYLIIEHYFY